MRNDPYKYFRVEARDIVDRLGKGVLDLEKGSGGAEGVPRLLRLAHTLKGAARVVKQREIADAAHTIEDTLAPFREATAPIPGDRLEAVLKLVDNISAWVAALAPVPDEAASTTRQVSEERVRTVRADVAEMDALLDGMAEASVHLAAVRDAAQGLGRARRVVNVLAEQMSVPIVRSGAMSGEAGVAVKTGALAAELRNLVDRIERVLTRGVEQIDQELRQVRHAAEQLRLLPVGSVFGVLERTARDAAHSTGKRVEFEGRGGEVRLDAHVLDTLQGALVQVVRNAVAHGIEPDQARRAAGKPAEGRLSIEVVRRGSRVAITCRDDGQGIDIDAIRRAALHRGLPVDDAKPLDPNEVIRLLLKGGISTSGAVTEISGRGLGLDIVREAAEGLGGDVRIETVTGQGTLVEIVVPVSIASLDVLAVEADGVAAAIPLESVRATLRIGTDDVTRTPKGDTILHEGRALCFLPLERSVTRRNRPYRKDKSWSAVIVAAGDVVAAIGVDRLVGTGTVVVRALPDLTPSDPVVSGASMDPEGNPQLVLDAAGLVAQAHGVADRVSDTPPTRRPVLVIDDSPTTRMLEQSILEAAGYEADVATSAEEALEKARSRRYGLFLVDVEMPGMDGFTFIERTRTDPVLREVPAILVTSRDSPEDRRRGETAGASAYIVKGEFDQADFLDRVHKLAA
jgi:two-component system chemotaxis sensor kinase CheA